MSGSMLNTNRGMNYVDRYMNNSVNLDWTLKMQINQQLTG